MIGEAANDIDCLPNVYPLFWEDEKVDSAPAFGLTEKMSN
jgi:hypothetical protein